ncbi:extracellular solute-binding protein [Fodinisporobacter ferrooxydans]|uniref:Extracellular solute-binding protein n=1 Tax=Fodinisporobacter ferrooxydans TaxID=2901836 RepID=A0ABY4CQD4_9BACL|nr:extracellular solute-binding protein [Alicyclobacillaceae bacterium MYW30-H2]
MKKKYLATASTLLLSASIGIISGCGSNSTNANGGTSGTEKITVYSTISDQKGKQAFQDITKAFEKENPNIKVELNFPGQGYENILKVKMAANDMPDVFDTHGWAKIRYGNFLADLHKEPWASKLDDNMKPLLTDAKGKVYALPLNEAKDGITYNADILKKYNIQPPTTFAELLTDAKKIKQESNGQVSPFFFSGIDQWTIGQFFDYMATPLLVSPKDNQKDALLNGTFDWSKWTYLPQKFQEMYKDGLINKDALTAKYSDLPQLFAKDKVAFVFFSPTFLDQAKQINPKLHAGYMPVPAIAPGDTPDFSGGERYTLGVWKDSKHEKAAIKLVDFFAQPENLKKMAEATELPPGIKGIQANLGDMTKYYQKYANVPVFSYFDRVYLPNGMWDVMCTQGQEILGNQITPQQFSDKMKQEYNRLRAQAKK